MVSITKETRILKIVWPNLKLFLIEDFLTFGWFRDKTEDKS